MFKSQEVRLSKLKTIAMAFSGLFIYAALLILFSYLIADILIQQLVSGLVFSILCFTYMTIVLGRFEPKVIVSRKFLYKSFIVVVVFSIAMFFISNIIVDYINDDKLLQKSIDYEALSLNMKILSTMMSVFLSPVVEECVFRGFMYRFLSKLNKYIAFIISSLMFAVMHGTITQIYVAFFGGLMFCCIYEKTRKLYLPIMAHMGYNVFIILLSYLFKYEVFSFRLSILFIMVIIMLSALIYLFKTPATYKLVIQPKVLTVEQKEERLQLLKIVKDVLNERNTK